MRTNNAALELIKSFESFVPHWYPDVVHGWSVPTCCYGHTDAAGEPKYAKTKTKRFTQEEASDILARDLEAVEFQVSTALTIDVNENQFGALVSFTYNLGGANLAKSTLLKRVNARKFDAAAKEFGKWVYANGKPLDGLKRRRAAEAALFAQGVVETEEPSDAPAEQPAAPSPVTTTNWLAALVQFIAAIAAAFKERFRP